MHKVELIKPPSTASNYLKLFTQKKPGIKEGEKLPEISYSLQDVKIEKQNVDLFNQVCGIKDSKIFITYPYVLSGPLALSFITDKNFPIAPVGLLHLRNSIELFKNLEFEFPYCLEIRTLNSRFRPQGFEFDLLTELKTQGEIVWACKSTFLKRGKYSKEDPPSEDEEIFMKLEDGQFLEGKIHIPSDIGKVYARICKDYNPIHISNIMAKILGYKRSIAHGMWTLARTASYLHPETSIKKLDAVFKGPVFTDSKVMLKRSGENVNIYCNDNPRPVILLKIK